MREPRQLAGVTPLTYAFATTTAADARLQLVAQPVHPVMGQAHVRLAFSVDGGPVEVADFETFGRSEE